MPKSPSPSLHLPLIFLLVTAIIISVSLITLPKSQIIFDSPPSPTSTPSLYPTPTITKRPPQIFETLIIDPQNIAVGDKYQSLTLREIKSLAQTINNRSDIEITFQGELDVEINPIKGVPQSSTNPVNKICSSIRNNKIPTLPRLKSPYQHSLLCFTNSKLLEKYLNSTSPIIVTIDDITLSTSPESSIFINSTLVKIKS